MRSLFWKIFLWFWAAQLGIAAALWLLALAQAASRGPDTRLRGGAGDSLEAWTRASAIAYELGGPKALQAAWTSPKKPDSGVENRSLAAFYNARYTNKPLVGPPLPNDAIKLVARTARRGEAIARTPDEGSWLGRRVVTPQGNVYVGVVKLRAFGRRNDSFADWRRPLRDAPLRFLIIGLTLGAVSLLLARTLTGPTLQLRQAAQQLAKGDLSARVGPQIAHRRDELGELGRDFDDMAERIGALMATERRLLGDISHELRSPLARMAVALDLIEDDIGDNATAQGNLARIRRESQNLNELIGQLLTLTRLESGNASLQTQTVDLEDLVRDIVQDADFEARARNRQVLAPVVEACVVSGDETLLRSAIENVVRNAVRHSPENKHVRVELRIEAPVATKTSKNAPAEPAPHMALIRVSDDGAGVPEDALDDLFKPFYRVGTARDRDSGGAGLGLSITQRAVVRHGGNVRASNAPEGGLIVELRLPISPQDGSPREK